MKSFAHAGVAAPQANDFSAKLAREGGVFERAAAHSYATEFMAARRRQLSVDEIRACQRKLEEIQGMAPVSRPDISERLTRIDAKVSSFRGAGM